ncbi:hypothetical protein GF389_04095 [Candidatus Dojkabacteria bacterium]|nr:hypothetical protein [Candidatus Dojkabacteria bacterium]
MDYKVFFDINCLVDILEGREENYKVIKELESRIDFSKVCISSLTIPNIHYICKPPNMESFEEFVMSFFVVSLSGGIIHKAFKKNMKDFEDAIQLASAESVSADYFLTWNVKDYKEQKSLVKVMTPKEFLGLLD